MKNKLFKIFILIIPLLFINKVYASNLLTYEDTITYNINNLSNIINLKTGYVLNISSTNTSISSYNNSYELIATKEFPELKKAQIINYNNNILLVGIKSNTISIYLLDSNLRVLASKDTSYIINQSDNINLHYYNNKVYMSITKNNVLSNNNIYEISLDLNIIENPFSSYSNIKEILKSNYFLIKYNNVFEEGSFINYSSGTTLNNKTLLIGTKAISDKQRPILSIYNNDILLLSKEEQQYDIYYKIITLKNKIAILAAKGEVSYLIILNEEGTLLEEIKIDSSAKVTDMYKVGDRLFFITSNDIVIYNYPLNISHNNSPFGTVTINNIAKEYDDVNISIVSNSGYEVDNVTITDAYGNILSFANNTFTMPDTDVYVDINYKETITNPNTADYIFIFLAIVIISFITGRYFYKKFIWLK